VVLCADSAACAAAGVPALHAAATKALSAALQHLKAPQHLGLLLYLPLLAQFSVLSAPLQRLP
jgi:hypothetical protein